VFFQRCLRLSRSRPSALLCPAQKTNARRGKTAAHGAAVFNATRSEVGEKKMKRWRLYRHLLALPSSFGLPSLLSRSNFPIILNLFDILLDKSQIKCYPYMCYENNK